MSERVAAPTRQLANALWAVRAYLAKPENGVGGSLHIALSDGNLEDDDLRFCERYAEERGDADGAQLARTLLGCTEDEREWLYEARRG